MFYRELHKVLLNSALNGSDVILEEQFFKGYVLKAHVLYQLCVKNPLSGSDKLFGHKMQGIWGGGNSRYIIGEVPTNFFTLFWKNI